MNLCTLVLLAALPGGTPGEDIAAKIVAAGHTKVGVIPGVISRKGTKEATVGSLGPRGATLARDVQNQLVTLSTEGKYRGKFTVVSERVMRSALNEVAKNRPIQVDDLGNPKALKALSSYTGAKGFVTLGIDETGGEQQVDVVDGEGKTESVASTGDAKEKLETDEGDLVGKRDNAQKIDASYTDDEGDEFHNETYVDRNTFAKAAYMGDSFELRRWQGNELVNMGLESRHPQFAEDSLWQFGLGEKWEREQFPYMKPSFEHPLDVDGFPFEIHVAVDDYIRKPRMIRDKYVVELNPGEEYYVYVKSTCSQPVMVAIYVDGVSTIDKERREPSDLEDARHWVLKDGYAMKIPGWYTIDRKLQTQQGNKFRIVERAESIAAQKSFGENIGMITLIFYVNDAVSGRYVKYPKDELLENARSVFGESQFGTGAGSEFQEDLAFESVKRGLMLAAVTYYYRSGPEIEQIVTGETDDPVLSKFQLASNRLKVDEPKKDEPKKDEPKKDDPKKDNDEPVGETDAVAGGKTEGKTKVKDDDKPLKIDP